MGDFVKAAKKSDIPTDTGYLVEIQGRPVALFRVGENVHALDSICPHQGGPLHEGGLEGGKVVCPWHGWEFNVANGVCTFNPSIKQTTYRTKEEGGDIYVEI